MALDSLYGLDLQEPFLREDSTMELLPEGCSEPIFQRVGFLTGHLPQWKGGSRIPADTRLIRIWVLCVDCSPPILLVKSCPSLDLQGALHLRGSREEPIAD